MKKQSPPVHASSKPRASVATKAVVKKLPSSVKSQSAPSLQSIPSLSDSALNEIIAPEDRWLSPKVIAAIMGVDEKWLSSVREGLKGVDGPPYKKLGDGRTAPIRYNYGEFKKWLEKFPTQLNTHGKTVSRFTSAGEFFASTDYDSPWLFAQVGDELQDIILAINNGAFDAEGDHEVVWLTFWQWLARASTTLQMKPVIAAALGSVRANAIEAYESAAFEQIASPGKRGVRKSIDGPKSGKAER